MTGILEDVRWSLSVLRGAAQKMLAERHSLRSRPAASPKKAPFLWMDYRNGNPEWQLVDYQAYVTEGYDVNSVIRAAIGYKERAIASVPLVAVKGDLANPQRLPPMDALARLLARPNIYQSWEQFQRQRVVYLNIAGNSYTYLERPNRKAAPVALYNLRPDRVTIVPDAQGGLLGFFYQRDRDSNPRAGLPILPSDMMHVKFSNPNDPLEGLGYGLSPFSAMAQSGDVDNQITAFLKLFFETGAMPSGLLSFDMDMTSDELGRARRIWNERYSGIENWGDVAVLDKNGKYQRIGLTFDEMGFEALDERNETRILGPFGVPPILLGTRVGLKRSTMANYEQARTQCWEDTLWPEVRLFQSTDQYYLQTDDGAYVLYDRAAVPALQGDTAKLVDAAYKLWTMGTPANQAYATVGLKVEPVPGGDTAYVSTSVMPVGGNAPPTPSEGDPVVGVEEDPRVDAADKSFPKATQSFPRRSRTRRPAGA